MPYLISALIAATGLVVLSIMLVRLGGVTRRLADTVSQRRAHFADRTRTLATRIAALRVALGERLHRPAEDSRPAPAA
ncbi:MAG TPA: hypothetical protein VFO16_24755 [Pseudonocardiaceae bacterium]|nr:hypothetical protein [Pseudonocardiaceae bacterium]